MAFYIGQKVVCVDARGRRDRVSFPVIPTEGAVYTIRGFSTPPAETCGIYLEEIVSPICQFTKYGNWVGEGSFNARRFRPVIEHSTETGMAILRKVALENTTKVTHSIDA